MVNPLETLHALDGTRNGPVSFEAAEAGIAATFNGDTAMVAVDGGTFRIRATAPCAWPEGDDGEVARRVHHALADIAAGRPELCLLRAHPSTVVAELWLDGVAAPFDVATAVRTTVLLVRVGVAVLDGLVREAAAEAALSSARVEAERAAEEAERALTRLLEEESHPQRGEQAGRAAAGPGPTSPAPAGPAATAPRAEAGSHPRSWCVADRPTEVHGLTAASGMVGAMRPGVRYEVIGEHPGWVRVRGEGIDGWVPAGAVRALVGREALVNREGQRG